MGKKAEDDAKAKAANEAAMAKIEEAARKKFEADKKAAEAELGVWAWDHGSAYYYNEKHRRVLRSGAGAGRAQGWAGAWAWTGRSGLSEEVHPLGPAACSSFAALVHRFRLVPPGSRPVGV